MHELSIAAALAEQIEKVRADHGAVRVVSATLALGALPVVTANTALDGMELVIEEVAAERICVACGRHSPAAAETARCTGCGSEDLRLDGGRDLLLRSVELSDEPGATVREESKQDV
jgi:Zn finger protein HypA/HybF involved in hydrogenase expression